MNRILGFAFLFTIQLATAQEWTVVPSAPIVKYRHDDIYFVNDSTGWAINGYGVIYKTNGKNQPWQVQFNAHRYMRSIEFIDDSTGFAGSLDSAVYMTTNAGKIWNRIDKTQSFNISGVCGISHLGNAVILVGSYFGPPHVTKSFDRGKTWVTQDMSSYVGGSTGGLIDAWYKSPDTVFVSGTTADNRAILLRSADAGSTWVNVTPNISVPVSYGWKLHFPTPSVGYLSVEEVSGSSSETHFLKSTDGGRSWKLMSAKLGKNIDLQGLGFVDANRGWIGGWSTGMYETNDGGVKWKLINSFSNLNRFFFLRSDFGYVSGTTIFQFKKGAVITGVQGPSEQTVDAHSLTIYPNPGQSESIAKVTLGTRTMVVLSLLDNNGKTIKEIYRGYADAGTHDHAIEIEALPPGEYIVLLLTNEHFLSRKLLKIKN